MRVLFAGPTLSGVDPAVLGGLDVRPPAGQGDLARAVLDGAEAIGLVDGVYENVAAVWHKEILFALEAGVAVLGAASMGALRAAECAALGMVGVGAVFERYRTGDLVDDDAVAQIHAPPELDHAPLNEALVNVDATVAALAAAGRVDADEAGRVLAAARALFFKRRTWPAILAASGLAPGRREAVAALVRAERVDVKRDDALALVARLRTGAFDPPRPPPGPFPRPYQFRLSLELISRARDGG